LKGGNAKKPAGGVAGGLGYFFEIFGRLDQAMMLRRHVGPVMMVVTEMEVALHL
jgi:hypothetical protein